MQHREGDRLRGVHAPRAAARRRRSSALFGALAGRLYHLQVSAPTEYALLADENRINQRLLPPARGRILDRHGVDRWRATSRPTACCVIREQAGDLRATLEPRWPA